MLTFPLSRNLVHSLDSNGIPAIAFSQFCQIAGTHLQRELWISHGNPDKGGGGGGGGTKWASNPRPQQRLAMRDRLQEQESRKGFAGKERVPMAQARQPPHRYRQSIEGSRGVRNPFVSLDLDKGPSTMHTIGRRRI